MPTTPIGGGVDGPNYADYDVNRLNATSANIRYVLGLVQNTDVIFVTNIGGKVTIYNAQPSAPTLMPVVQLRKSPFAEKNSSQKDVDAKFQSMVKDLPPQLKKDLEEDMKLPAGQRNEKLVAFQQVLEDMAELSLWAANFNSANASAPTEITSVAFFRTVQAASNGVQVLDNMFKKAQAEYDLMPDVDPNKVVFGEYLIILSRLIGKAKQLMQSMQVNDAEKEKEYAVAQQQVAMQKLADQLEAFQKAAEAKAKQAKMDLIMKITGPIIAILALAATVLSGGSLTAVLIAVLTTALTMADTFTSFMTTGIQTALSNLPSPGKELVAIALIIVIMIIARKVSGVGSSMVKQASKEAAEKAVANSSKMVTAGIGMTLMSSSGTIASTFDALAKACYPDDSEAAQLMSMIPQMLTMLLMALITGKWMGNIGTDKAAMLADILSDSLAAGTKGYQAYTHVQLGILAKEQKDIEASITQLETALEILGMSKKQIQAAIKDIHELAQLWGDLFRLVMKEALQVNAKLAQAAA